MAEFFCEWVMSPKGTTVESVCVASDLSTSLVSTEAFIWIGPHYIASRIPPGRNKSFQGI